MIVIARHDYRRDAGIRQLLQPVLEGTSSFQITIRLIDQVPADSYQIDLMSERGGHHATPGKPAGVYATIHVGR